MRKSIIYLILILEKIEMYLKIILYIYIVQMKITAKDIDKMTVEDLRNNLKILINKENTRREKMKMAQKRYFQSAKGKLKSQEIQMKYNRKVRKKA
jgi:hypothetical protein